jgi:predicted DNA-binding transcriptional regulator AlpA
MTVTTDANRILAEIFPTPPLSPPLLKIAEVAVLLGVSEATARRYHRTGQLPAPAVSGGCVTRWRRADPIAWLGLDNDHHTTNHREEARR